MRTGALEMAIDLYMKAVYVDAKKGKISKETAETLEILIRSWSMIQTVENASEVTDRIQSITGRSPELPFEFPKVRTL